MKPIEKELDKLVQMLHLNQYCHICGKVPATEVHHIIGRSNPMLRYDLVNLCPVCRICHSDIHDGRINIEDRIPKEIWGYLQQVKNQSYKDFLLFEQMMTEDEYLKKCRNTLRGVIKQW